MTFWQKLKYLFKPRDLGFTLLIFAVVIGLAMCKSDTQISVYFNDDSVGVVAQRFSMNIPYDMVESIELTEVADAGEVVKGQEDLTVRTGVWHNEAWGEYHACLDRQTTQCIVVHLNDGRTFVFSHADDETTAAEFASFQERLLPPAT